MVNVAENRSWAARAGLYMTLAQSTLVLALDAPNPSTDLTQASIYTPEQLGGKPVAAIFSTIEQLDTYEPLGLDAVVLNGFELFPYLAGQSLASVLINPGGIPRGELYANELLTIENGLKKLRH